MKKIEPYFLDDSCKIPEYIKQMSKEDRQREIKRFEDEARKKRKTKNWQQCHNYSNMALYSEKTPPIKAIETNLS